MPLLAHYWSNLHFGMVLLNLLPFALLLLAIAILPLTPAFSSWWEKHSSKFLAALLCAAAGVLLYFIPTQDSMRLTATLLDYLAFISLLAALFMVSGGIQITGAFAGLPWINTLFLGAGALLASILGTTGASMLLIRPLIRANRLRQHKTHIIIFFIFLVSNCGGLLTPLGDPPLYLGFLRGVPFTWTLSLFPHWALMLFALLFIFHLLDERTFEREELQTKHDLVKEIADSPHRLRIQGRRNLILLAAILGIVLFSGQWLLPFLKKSFTPAAAENISKLYQIVSLACISWLAFRWTPKQVHEHNHFSLAPISEVAILFFGIFGAMLPALAVLEYKAPGLALSHAWQYFWFSGGLSSFLDNAPTYLAFASLAAGKSHLPAEHLGLLASQAPALLKAIAVGAVFMGANTYIGNGPNFMVKSIAEHARIKMPSFLGYMLWSASILIPLFILETFLFFL